MCEFVEELLHLRTHGLRQQRHRVVSVNLAGDAQALVLRVGSVMRGKLTTPVIHAIYPFVLGNTVFLDELIHQEIAYDCAYFFFFRSDGQLERESVELGTVMGQVADESRDRRARV